MINTVLTNMDLMKKDLIAMDSIFTGLIDGGSMNTEMMPASHFATKTVLIEMAMTETDITGKAVIGFTARAKKLRKKPKKKLHGRKNRMMPLID